MLEDKNIHDIFEHANVDNEDWLQPSDTVFEEIEAAIYPPRNFRWFWFILPLLFLISAVGLGVYFYVNRAAKPADVINKKAANISYKNTEKSGVDLVEHTPATHPTVNQAVTNWPIANQKNIDKPVDPVVIETSVNPKSNETLSNQKIVDTLSNQKNSETSLKQKVVETLANLKNKKATKQAVNAVVKKNLPTIIVETDSQAFKNKVVENVAPAQKMATTILSNNVLVLDAKNKTTQDKKQRIEKNTSWAKAEKKNINRPTISDKPLITPTVLLTEKSKSIVVTEEAIENVVTSINRLGLRTHVLSKREHVFLQNSSANILSNKSKFVQYEFSTGYSGWNLRLNQAFARALKPAKFKYTSGKGFYVSGGVQKNINPKIALKANLQYEQIVLSSSHNTAQQYQPNDETTETTNNFAVKIASPMGFINSELTVKRTNAALDEATDLSIDLQNRHQMFTLDAGIGVSAQFINFVKLSGETIFLTGIHQVLAVNNRLSSFQTNHPNFEAFNHTKPSGQTQLQKTRPYVGLGIQFYYKINAMQAIRFQYLFKQDVWPLYKEDAFRTIINRQQMGFSYLLRFK